MRSIHKIFFHKDSACQCIMHQNKGIIAAHDNQAK